MPSISSIPAKASRQRMERGARGGQLLETARRMIRASGVNALTLGRLAEEAGVTKPVVYSHFYDRNALLLALYAQYDEQQALRMERIFAAAPATLQAVSSAIAETYVDCVLGQGVEIPGVGAALSGAPELEVAKQQYDEAWQARCRELLAPFSSAPVSAAGLLALQGAADALSSAAVQHRLSREEACGALAGAIIDVVNRA